MNEYKILVVDDEEDICEILQFNLQLEGFKVDVAHSAEEAMTLKLKEYNLILLDVMMGKISGFRMMQLMRQNDYTAHIPIIFITARDTENDVVTGFNLGADDYISKPFGILELVARINANIRKTATVQPALKFKDITVDSCKEFLKAIGLPESPIENVTFENISSPSHQVILQDVGAFSIKW